MSHHTLDDLIELWKREKLTTEQMVGQLLLVLKDQERRIREVVRPAEGVEAAGKEQSRK
jgi:hypothetical protein